MRCKMGIFATIVTAAWGCAEIDPNAAFGEPENPDTYPLYDAGGDKSAETPPGSDRTLDGGEGETDSARETETDTATLSECTEENAEAICGDADLCSDGFCCDRPCHGVCEACHIEGFEGTCRFLTAESVCRSAMGPCDEEETCTGSSSACPTDTLHGAGTECRGAAGVCDEVENCSGSSPYCPVDAYKGPSFQCRTGLGGCDTSEYCNGYSAQCPPDAFGTVSHKETFDSSALPLGWEIIDGDDPGYEPDGATWEHGVSSPPGGGDGGYWMASSDKCQCRMNDSLVTDWYDVTSCGSVTIEFDHAFSYDMFGYLPDDGYVLITFDDDEWFVLGEYHTNSSGHQVASGLIGTDEQTFRLKFLYDSFSNYWWKIDNVEVIGSP